MTTALTDRATARYHREHAARPQHSNGALTAEGRPGLLVPARGIADAI